MPTKITVTDIKDTQAFLKMFISFKIGAALIQSTVAGEHIIHAIPPKGAALI